MPPCRNPAVTNRHHCPSRMAGGYFAPNKNSVCESGSMPPWPERELARIGGQIQAGVDQHDDDGGKSRVRNQPTQRIGRAAPFHRAGADHRLAIRTDFVVSSNECPAIRAHPPLIHFDLRFADLRLYCSVGCSESRHHLASNLISLAAPNLWKSE